MGFTDSTTGVICKATRVNRLSGKQAADLGNKKAKFDNEYKCSGTQAMPGSQIKIILLALIERLEGLWALYGAYRGAGLMSLDPTRDGLVRDHIQRYRG